MPLDIYFSSSAEKDMRRLDPVTQKRIFAALKQMETDPRPRGVEKIKGYPDLLRVRVGDFRIIYHIHDERVIIVLLVKDRKHVYETHGLQALQTRLARAKADNVVSIRSRKPREG